ncbi:crotonase/enoyl-CoA hydratase family protein [Arenimonas fontis]|uniref:Crotonase/enoyl-CoA hydratase family protein n=1 Tax=Arenimonas fontis TaxID=2608255 RepID=A0A5B2ZDD5_9GAMM|nr:crotonase/enoyl-CoA hydratase family protein [Arenimonas fontis]KAA2286037.1 crotonase/enoyl-CoA hydratase family protein [Arenimonas fontis]
MSPVVELPNRPYSYRTIRCQEDPTTRTSWMYMHAHRAQGAAPGRPCFSLDLMKEMRDYLANVSQRSRQTAIDGREPGLDHLVICSDASAFNLGGDLELFARLIRERDRASLLAYARMCVEGVYHLHTQLGGRVNTIALVQGDALGGGLELALSCQTLVAEEGAALGFPEVLFDLFPGMGAYTFLCRRVSPVQAEKLMLDGNVYTAEQMYAMGIVDLVVPRGQGVQAVQDLLRQHRRSPHARLALQQVRDYARPASLEELMRITEIWVDTAMQLGERSLRTMERLVRAQERRAGEAAAATSLAASL